MKFKLPLIIEANVLHKHLGDDKLVIIDLSIPQVYKEGHIPGAIHLSYPSIVHAHDNVDCDIPPDNKLSEALSKIGLLPEHKIVAYDSQHNPMACRLLWTLEELGFQHGNLSILNGGWHAWKECGLPIEESPNTLPESGFFAKQSCNVNARREYIESRIGDSDVVILDTRMIEEFTNELLICDRGGNIPGAIHFDWENNVNTEDAFRFHSDEVLLENFAKLGVVPEKEIIIYCQTHFRSAHTYWVLRHLGFRNIRGYASGYSEWGNAEDTPIENEAIEA
ncbi:MAG: sulfurtransferase [Gammaproteobacteria bacterium]|nr:sulfurtransferase [Gammaproteobacteria bacterium]